MELLSTVKAHNRKAVALKWNHFCDPTLAFSQDSYQGLLDIWRAKAGARKMPTRSDITPRDLKDFLKHIVLIQRERENPPRYIWRIVGTGITDILGHSNAGKSFEDSVPPQHLDRWIEVSNLILEGERPLRLRGRVHINGRDYLDAENLYLPLSDDSGRPTYILGFCRYTPHVSDTDNWENELASIPGGLL